MLNTRCRIERKETMTERHSIWHVADQLQMNLRACQAQLVELRSYLAALNLEPGWTPPRAGSPRELHPDACPHCELAAGHTNDCPTVTGENPAYGPDNPDWQHDLEREQTA